MFERECLVGGNLPSIDEVVLNVAVVDLVGALQPLVLWGLSDEQHILQQVLSSFSKLFETLAVDVNFL
jgi:hypothetical protein